MGIRTSVVGISDIGKHRKKNEDSILLVDLETGTVMDGYSMLERDHVQNRILFVVSDGMGGYDGGEVASKMTVETIVRELRRLPKQLSPPSRLEAAIEEANYRLWKYRSAYGSSVKMGATATAVLVEGDRIYIADVGDSRAFIVREGRIKQLTTDQTLTQMLVQAGALTEEEAGRRKSVLLQAIGSNEYLQIPVSALQLQRGDILVLCTDGLTTKVKNREIMNIVRNESSLESAAKKLVCLANERGGDDNISIILARFEGDELQEKIEAETITKQIEVYASYDPSQSAEAKPRREVRAATFEDWLRTAVVSRFCQTPQQVQQLFGLGSFGDYVVFRKGDYLFPSEEQSDHYWLVCGKYRVLYSDSGNSFENYCFFVAPTDHRTDAEIQQGEVMVRVRRQFFINTLAMLGSYRKAIRCEDDENAMIRVPYNLYCELAKILGKSYVNLLSRS
ncbi:MAG: protein phosphatase 2C domain-containing protein [Acidobacteriota bacterium]|nr:protein phosphatase 2C domain-containing protein [Blastocatellia bacterium]MDW8411313.1 protein phosphatase 2C domain-containing protein [Acidobacteriota bacterium]